MKLRHETHDSAQVSEWVQHVIAGTRLEAIIVPPAEELNKWRFDGSPLSVSMAWPLPFDSKMIADPREVAMDQLWGKLTERARLAYSVAIGQVMPQHYARLRNPGPLVDPQQSLAQAVAEASAMVRWFDWYPPDAQFFASFHAYRVRAWMA